VVEVQSYMKLDLFSRAWWEISLKHHYRWMVWPHVWCKALVHLIQLVIYDYLTSYTTSTQSPLAKATLRIGTVSGNVRISVLIYTIAQLLYALAY